jgi:hypothetical protein
MTEKITNSLNVFKMWEDQIWWYTSVIPAIWEAKIRGL